MQLVTNKAESAELVAHTTTIDGFRAVALYDVVLDDGTWLTDAMVIGDRVFGLLIGLHTVFCYFADHAEELAGRTVRAALPLRRPHYLFIIGWARRHAAVLEYPRWRPRL